MKRLKFYLHLQGVNIYSHLKYTKTIVNRSEKDLMLLSSTGDTHAFTQLFHLYKDKLYSFVLKLTGCPQTAEDIIQEIFAKIWDKRQHLTEVEKFGSYLFRMAQNYAINGFRKMTVEMLAVSRLQSNSEYNPTDVYLEEKETSALLHQAISRLSTQQKLVYTLSREQGLKYEEIARKLNLSPSTVKNHMLAALQSLRASFAASADSVRIFIITLGLSSLL